ncbi:baseplate J/gp47 family protein [Campylobacter sp. RM12637]|uniref:baseplate J/gp47 family protein n=1 Tax=Campylobacter sp. RM12637 TaxID=2735734 RepID=UPI003014CD09|nr:baseplate J/gp47 family protein [Campylobacter sp. RM12637]
MLLLEKVDFEKILSDLKFIATKELDDVNLLESDSLSALLQCYAYREVLLRSEINEKVKALLIEFARNDDLDKLVKFYDIKRLAGTKPKAQIEFKLNTILDADVIIPKDSIFHSNTSEVATLDEDVIIKSGELSNLGTITLNKYIKSSTIKCELLQTPLPFLVECKQKTDFINGADAESDEDLRTRAILSLEKPSTAGSSNAYIYHTKSANAKIKDVKVLNGGAGIVRVIIKSDNDANALNDIVKALNDEKTRPLTDIVKVEEANKKEIIINATIYKYDMLSEYKRDDLELNINENISLSAIYEYLHDSSTQSVEIDLKNNLTTLENEFLYIKFNFTFRRAL